MEIRYTQASDIADLKDILDQTSLFPSAKLEGMLTSFLDGDTEDLWLTCENGGKAIGFCHAAPNEMVDGAWCMPAIAILPKYQRKGVGRALAEQMEAELAEQSAHAMQVDTSAGESFSGARQFFENAGYTLEARTSASCDRMSYKKALA